MIDRGELLTDEEAENAIDYKRYAYTKSGISPRAFPGQGKALVVADSDEHNESGHIIEDAETRVKMMDKRMRKNAGLQREIKGPIIHHRDNPKYNLIGWGSTMGAIGEAACQLETHRNQCLRHPPERAVAVPGRRHWRGLWREYLKISSSKTITRGNWKN